MTAQKRESPAPQPTQLQMHSPNSPTFKSYRRRNDPHASPPPPSRENRSSEHRRPSDDVRPSREGSPSRPVSPRRTQPQPNLHPDDLKHYLNRKLRFLHTDERHVVIAICTAHLKGPANRRKEAITITLSPFVREPDTFVDKLWKYLETAPPDEPPPAASNLQNGREARRHSPRPPSQASLSDGRSRRRRRGAKSNRSRSSSASSQRRYTESRDRKRPHDRRSKRRRKRSERERRHDRRYDYHSDSDYDERGRHSRKRRRRHRYSDEESERDRDRHPAERDSRRYEADRDPDDRHPEERDRSPPRSRRRPEQRYSEGRDRSPYGRPDSRHADERERERELERDRTPPPHRRGDRPRDLRNELSRRTKDDDRIAQRRHGEASRHASNVSPPRGTRRPAYEDEGSRDHEQGGRRDESEHKPSPGGQGSSVDSKGNEASMKLQHLRSKALASLKKTPSFK